MFIYLSLSLSLNLPFKVYLSTSQVELWAVVPRWSA